jgi:hypothetical protein
MFFHPDPRFNLFFLLTGFSFMTFASGFSACLFNVETVGTCVEVANHWVGIFQNMGNHIITWAFALFHAAMNQG